MKTMPGALGDSLRGLQNMPGVVALPANTASFTTNFTTTAATTLPATVQIKGNEIKVPVLAPNVTMADTQQPEKFGVAAVPVVLEPGVQVSADDTTRTFVPSAFNKAHAKVLARSEKAQGMAINMYSAFWSLVVSIVVTVVVSLFTKPKPDSELKDLVMGLTKVPDQGPCPWYQSPKFWVVIVSIVLVAINIIFW